MTEEEREMMNTIHVYGLFYSMSDDKKTAVINRIEEILKEDQT